VDAWWKTSAATASLNDGCLVLVIIGWPISVRAVDEDWGTLFTMTSTAADGGED